MIFLLVGMSSAYANVVTFSIITIGIQSIQATANAVAQAMS